MGKVPLELVTLGVWTILVVSKKFGLLVADPLRPVQRG